MFLFKGVVFCIAIGVAAVLAIRSESQSIEYPETRKGDQVDDYFGVRVADPYRWLEDANSKETGDWVAAQNKITHAYLNKLPQREPFKQRLTKLIDYPKYRPPFREGGKYFFFKNDGLQNQSVLYTQDTLKSPPRVLIDPNTLSKDGTVSLSAPSISHDGKLMAYGLQTGGSDWQIFQVREVETGHDRPDELRWIKNSGVAWTHDQRGFFYTRYPQPEKGRELQQANRDAKIYYHVIGNDQAADPLVFAVPDQPEWGMYASVTEDGRYAVISIHHGTDPRNRIYYIDLNNAAKPDIHGKVVKLLDDFDAYYYLIGNDGPVFYFRTDLDAPRGKVIQVDTRNPERSNWKTVVAETKDTLQRANLVLDKLALLYLHDAHSRMEIRPLAGGEPKAVELPGLGAIGELTGRRKDKELFFSFTSFLYPPSVFRCALDAVKPEVFQSPQLDFDPSRFETKQVFYTSKDGTRVPMFITHRKGLEMNGKNPVYLYGYGGFNISMTPSFSASAVIWMEHGGVYAVPNLRGGGEYGREWHLAGTLEHKQNVFDDFISAAEYLIKEKYTAPGKIAIAGGSNGGLLVGACMTQRPDLFGVALPAVGVLDMLRYDKFTVGRFWQSDYGTSDNPSQFKTLYEYSPLHHLKPGTHYPPTLITTGDHDDRVVPAHSFKFAAALQSAQLGSAPTLIRIETKAGHGAGKPTTKLIEEAADVWAFAMRHTGMDFGSP